MGNEVQLETTNRDSGFVKIKERSTTIDVMRGIAMILIITLHMPLTQARFGYAMKMMLFYSVPLYFIVSGYLLSSSAGKNNFLKYLWKRIKSLLFPYIFFFLFSYLWTNTVRAYSLGEPLFSNLLPWPVLRNSFVFAGKYLFESAVILPTLWFLHALFLTSIAFYVIAKIKNKYIVFIIAFILLLSAVPIKQAFENTHFWILAMFPTTLFFMIVGHICRLIMNWYRQFENKVSEKYKLKDALPLANSFLAIVLLIINFFFMQLGRGDIWDYTSDWYFLSSLVFSLAILLFARETQNRIFIFMGKNSLYYLVLHSLVLQLPIIDKLPKYFSDHGLDEKAAFLCYFIISIMCVSIFVFVVVFIKDKVNDSLKRMLRSHSDAARTKNI